MVRLIHCKLVCWFFRIIVFRITVFHYFMHLNFVSNTWGWLWSDHVVHSLLLLLILMNIVLTTSWSSASWVWIDATNSLISSVAYSGPPWNFITQLLLLILIFVFQIVHSFFFGYSDTATFVFLATEWALSVYWS